MLKKYIPYNINLLSTKYLVYQNLLYMMKKLIPSIPKLTAKLTYNKRIYFLLKKKHTKQFNIYTSYIKIQ